jgi:hypothetical protein
MQLTIRQFTITTITPNLPMYRAYQLVTWLTPNGTEDDWAPLTMLQMTIDDALTVAQTEYPRIVANIHAAYDTAISIVQAGHALPAGR